MGENPFLHCPSLQYTPGFCFAPANSILYFSSLENINCLDIVVYKCDTSNLGMEAGESSCVETEYSHYYMKPYLNHMKEGKIERERESQVWEENRSFLRFFFLVFFNHIDVEGRVYASVSMEVHRVQNTVLDIPAGVSGGCELLMMYISNLNHFLCKNSMCPLVWGWIQSLKCTVSRT